MAEHPHQHPIEDFIYYSEDLQELVWKERTEEQEPEPRLRNSFNKRWANKPVVGSVTTNGYRQVSLYGKTYSYHHVVWFLKAGEWPSMQIDHINRDRLDNKFDNLRHVSASQNCRNSPLRSNNTTGVVGVAKRGQSWGAYICGRSLGRFSEFEDVVACRKAAEVKEGFHENHGK